MATKSDWYRWASMVTLTLLAGTLLCSLAGAQAAAPNDQTAGDQPAVVATCPAPVVTTVLPAPAVVAVCPPGSAAPSCARPGVIALYGWLPGIDATIGLGGFETTVSESITDLLHKFKGGGMVHYESGGKTNVVLDVMYAKLGDTIERPLTTVDFTVKQWLVEAGITFGRTGSDARFAEWLVGGRYFSLDNTLTLSPPDVTVSGSLAWTELFVGGRYGAELSDRWSLLAMANVGGFAAGSHGTWEGVLRFNYKLREKTALTIGARYLNLDYEKDHLTFSGTFFGPLIGVGWEI